MSLVFAGITPHPPLLLPHIGKEESDKLKKTKEAFAKLEESLYLSKPHIIIIISPHGDVFNDSFCINAHTNFIGNFEIFGDHSIQSPWHGAPDFAARVGHMGNEERLEIQLISQEKLDYGATIPLHFVSKHLPDVKILPVSPSKLSTKDHLAFGSLIKESCMNTDKRVALIASAELSHTLSSEAPGGFSKEGSLFDNKIIESLEARNSTGIINLASEIVASAQPCGYTSLLILLGALQNMNYEFKNMSYETPFGIGYLTGEFIFE